MDGITHFSLVWYMKMRKIEIKNTLAVGINSWKRRVFLLVSGILEKRLKMPTPLNQIMIKRFLVPEINTKQNFFCTWKKFVRFLKFWLQFWKNKKLNFLILNLFSIVDQKYYLKWCWCSRLVTSNENSILEILIGLPLDKRCIW